MGILWIGPQHDKTSTTTDEHPRAETPYNFIVSLDIGAGFRIRGHLRLQIGAAHPNEEWWF